MVYELVGGERGSPNPASRFLIGEAEKILTTLACVKKFLFFVLQRQNRRKVSFYIALASSMMGFR